MNINITLIIQGINFFIAYSIIKRILLVPVLRIVFNEKAVWTDIREAIAVREQSIEHTQLELAASWQTFQEDVAHKMPLVGEQRIFKGIKPALELHVTPSLEVRQLSHEMVTTLVQKVKHVGI